MDFVAISDTVIVITGFIIPIILLPQIVRIIKLKEANAVSLLTLWGSLLVQISIFVNAYLHWQPQLMFTMLLSIVPLSVLVSVAHWYR